MDRANKLGKGSLSSTKRNYKKLKSQINKFKTKRQTIKQTKKNIKKGTNTVKKATQQMRKVPKNIRKVSILARYALVKVAVVSFTAIKTAIGVVKLAIGALIGAGYVVVLLIIVVAVIACICCSAFGIFFSNEVNNGDITMSSVISEINEEVNQRIIDIQAQNEHEDYELISNMSKWEELLALYSAKISGGEMKNEVITLTEERANILKSMFWQMNSITSSVDDKKMLTIKISSKSLEEMMNLNNFTQEQRMQVNELLDDNFSSVWNDVIYGKSIGNKDIVKIAESQIGNIGGQKFWQWYGFNSRVEWCAIFVSWVANEAGYLNTAIPKFAQCHNQGIVWFQTMSLWHGRGFTPKSGDIIFFDWEQDGHSDHVGIVEKVSNGKVYTIEGNSNNRVQKQNYKLNSKVIYGYGTPQY